MQRLLLEGLVAASYLLLAGGPRWALWTLLGLALTGWLWSWRGGQVEHRDLSRRERPDVARRELARTERPDVPRTERRDLGRTERRSVSPGVPDPVARTGTLLVAAITAQLIPLPPALVAALSPHAETARLGVQLIPTAGWRPLSIDPSATTAATGAVLLALVTYRLARATFDGHGGVRRFVRHLAWGATLAAVVAVVQRAAAPTMVMGVISAEVISARPFGPFVNRNHFAAWLLLVAPLVAGSLIAHLRHHLADEPRWRHRLRHVLRSAALPLLAALVVIIGVLVSTLSRSAVLGLGAAGATAWLLARRRLDWREGGWLLAVGALGAGLLVAAVAIDLDAWAARLESTFTAGPRPDDRLVIWRDTLPVVADFWAWGTGAGTYGLAMLTYQQARIWVPHLAAWAHFNQAHNHYLHVLAEGGLLLSVPALLVVAAIVRAARQALASDGSEIFWIRAGAAAALIGIAVQSLWEIPLAMPANAVLAAIVTAILLHEPRAAR
jgi:O-antigen ligase